MEMGSSEIILGMKWLSTIGETKNDWKNLTMVLNVNRKKMVLKGNPNLQKSKISLRSMSTQVAQIGEWLLIEFIDDQSLYAIGRV